MDNKTRSQNLGENEKTTVESYNGREIGGFKAICSGKCVMASGCSFSVCTWISIITPSML
jgi:hypothetical protein